ncbi:STAS domain-containing protein [Planomonospora corallina]|uniref:Anti-sigma factor antagonist n=1 Tax=Planomonospora corallina TaxID=1806052 RepID=A0ABV8I3W6_9ACTN
MVSVPPEENVFDIELGARGRCAVVRVRGELDWAASPSLRIVVEQLRGLLGGGCLILDFTALTFCDSTAIGTLAMARHECREHGIRLVLTALPVFLRRMLTTTGLISVFEVRETLESALDEVDGWDSDGRAPAFSDA